MAKSLCAALALFTAGCGLASDAFAANGCGPGFYRTINGFCEPNARVLVGPGRAVILPPPCPRGFRRDPDPRRPLCYPVY